MSPFSGSLWQALISPFQSKHRARRTSSRPRRSSLGQYAAGERLEVRSLMSADPIVASPVAIHGFENQPLTNVPVAVFTDGNGSTPAANFSAAIVWGDGATTAGNISESNGVYVVSGSHTYTDVYTNPVIVGIVDNTNLAANALVIDQTNIAPILPDGTQGTPDQRYVYQVLKTTLDRPVSMQDVNYWTAQFVKNDHDRQTFVYILLENTPPYEFYRGEIANAYQTYLHRAPDAAGEAYFLQLKLDYAGVQVGSGADFGAEKRTSAMMISSDEFYNDAGGTPDGFITAAFQDTLKRAPTASDLAYFNNQLAHGVTRIEIAGELLSSYEGLAVQINGLFERYLGRAADPYGLQTFVYNFNSGYGTDSNTETLLISPEFYDRAVGLPLNTIS